MAAVYATSSNQVAALKELYKDSNEYMKDLVYKENPLLALMPKDESEDGFVGKYIPVPMEYGTPMGRSHSFSNAQNQQTAASLVSFFVYVIQDYQLVTITNLLMEQTKSNAGAFINAAKLQLDGGFRTLTNNIAFELFSDGSGTRGFIGSTSSAAPVYTITLSNLQQVVNFEVGMLLVNYAYSSGTISSISSTTGLVTAVNRATGVVTVTASSTDSSWATAGNGLGINGDVIAGAVNTGTSLCLAGLQAWIPTASPASNDSFWGVNRSVDPTRLGGLRFDASAYTIEEGLTNALAFSNREGAKPDLAIMDFASYAALVNSLGGKVVNIQVKHDEVEVAFDGIAFQSSYGKVTVLADRSCPPQTCFLLTIPSWKLRSIGKIPHILTYGMEGLEGLRVGSADALEIRIAYYGNLICSAPGQNCTVKLSA